MFLTLIRCMVVAVAVLPLTYYLVAIACAIGFFRSREDASDGPAPPISILKPVHGLDREAYQNFATFCRQDYPEYEILFAVAEEDPAIPVVRKLIRDFPDVTIRLLIGYEPLGSNDKVNKLCRLT